MFIFDRDKELTFEKVTEIIQKFELNDKPQLEKYHDYYLGKQNIIYKIVNDNSKPNNKIVTNYCYNITQNYLGYLTGIGITYQSDKNMKETQRILHYNDVKTTDSELLRNALIYGVAYEIAYLDEDLEQRFKVLDSRECIPIYDNTINQDLLYVIRYYLVDNLDFTKGYYVEIYSEDKIQYFRSNEMYSSLAFVKEVPHYFGQVPITVFSLNTEKDSIFKNIMTLQDAYNTLLSSEVDDFEAFCNAYLVLTGVDVEKDDVAAMKENRTIVLPPDGATAQFLVKNISDTQIENMLKNINDTIHKIANSPDFSQESFGVSSGIALRFRLLGFENTASAIESNMKKALLKRLELITSVLQLKGFSDYWEDMDIIFTRNIPQNTSELVNMVTQLQGVVSNETLLSLLPFVSDVNKEIKKVEKQKEQNRELYGFTAPTEDSEDKEEDKEDKE